MSNGVTRVDSPSIAGTDFLWRGLFEDWIVSDGNGGERVSSAAFKQGNDPEMSVDDAKLSTVLQSLARGPWAGLAQVRAQVPRDQNHIVGSDPLPNNPAHALICRREAKTTSGQARAMASQSLLVLG